MSYTPTVAQAWKEKLLAPTTTGEVRYCRAVAHSIADIVGSLRATEEQPRRTEMHRTLPEALAMDCLGPSALVQEIVHHGFCVTFKPHADSVKSVVDVAPNHPSSDDE